MGTQMNANEETQRRHATWNMPYCADKCLSDASMIAKTNAAAIIEVMPRARSLACKPGFIGFKGGAPANGACGEMPGQGERSPGGL